MKVKQLCLGMCICLLYIYIIYIYINYIYILKTKKQKDLVKKVIQEAFTFKH